MSITTPTRRATDRSPSAGETLWQASAQPRMSGARRVAVSTDRRPHTAEQKAAA